MTAHTLLLLLPADAGAAAPWLRLTPTGQVLERGLATPARPVPPAAAGARQVLAVPGSAVRVHWLELPARNPVQALAAARLLLADEVAGPSGGLHLAIGAAAGADAARPVAVVEAARLRAWLERATELGVTATAAVPTPLLLPLPADDAGNPETAAVSVAEFEGEWLVRGPHLAFAAEPVLARAVIGARPVERQPEAAAALAAGLASGAADAIDLLQYDFARSAARPQGWAAWRRPAVLAAALLLSAPLLLAARWGWHAHSANALEAQARVEAGRLHPGLAAGDDPLLAVRELVARARAQDEFARAMAALLAAVEASGGTTLDALGYDGTVLRATVAHPQPQDLEPVRERLARAGFVLAETGARAAEGRVRTEIEIHRGPAQAAPGDPA